MERDIKKFESPMRWRLWLESAALIPINISTAWIKDDVLSESCRQLYNYISDGFDDILEYPAENYLDPFDPAFDNPNNGNTIADSLVFHRNILDTFFKGAFAVENDSVMIKNPEYDRLLRNRKNIFLTNVRDVKDKIPFKFDDLLVNLSRRGIMIRRFANETVITNEKYPQMFLSAKLLRDACGIGNLDFRLIENPKRKLELDDIFYPLSSDECEMVKELIDICLHKKLKGGFRKRSGSGMYPCDYSFDHNKRHLMAFVWRTKYGLKIKLTLPECETAEHELLTQKVNELENAEEIKDFCIKNLQYCGYCNTGCVKHNAYKKKWLLLGRPLPKIPPACWGFGLFFPLEKQSLNITKTLINILCL